MDNDAFTSGFRPDKFSASLAKMDPTNCLFVSVPDVVGDWPATLALFGEWAPRVRDADFPVAVVGQDGATADTVPWDDIEALFIGGTVEWKLGPVAADLCREAKRRGKWVHMGRVNSMRRMCYAKRIGADSVDGTFQKYDPPRVARFLRWLSGFNKQQVFRW